MSEANKVVRLSKAAREFNISIDSVIEFLGKKGFVIDRNPNTKLDPQMYDLLFNEFQEEKHVKEISKQKGLEFIGKQSITIENPTVREEKKQEEYPIDDEVIIKNTGVEYFKKSLKNIPSTAAERNASRENAPNVIPEREPVKKSEEPSESPKAEIIEKKPALSQAEPELVKTTEVKEVKTQIIPERVPEPEKVVEAEKITVQKPEPEEKVAERPIESALPAIPEPIAPTLESTRPQPEETQGAAMEPEKENIEEETVENLKGSLKVYGTIDLDSLNQRTRPKKKSKAEKKKEASDKQKSIDTFRKKDKPVEKAAPAVDTKKTEEVSKKPVEKEAPGIETSKPAQILETKSTGEKQPDNFLKTKFEKLAGPVIFGKIDLPIEIRRKKGSPVASSSDDSAAKKKKRKRIKVKPDETQAKQERPREQPGKKKFVPPVKKPLVKTEPTDEEIQKKIKDTLARLAPTGKSKAAKHRKEKREHVSHNLAEEMQRQEDEKSILKVTEFLTANELANLMNTGVTQIITTCMQLGMFVSINQRLDAETIALVAEEFGFKVAFISLDDTDHVDLQELPDDPAQMVERAPIVTVMGHVDHGKTKLLDHIRKANVVAGEAGGITQHIGAYEVTTDSGKKVTFLDTPGHEAFTAMRARGAKVTDIAIIVIAADDSVMPQTREAINHAQAAGVPLVFAFNKMDKPGANSEKIKEQLANMNILVEDWGGKYQSQEISAINGTGVAELLEKVLLESEMLQLQANPTKLGRGTVIEASLDKGRGFVATVLVQDGTMKKGDIILAGSVYGKVKAMFNERNKAVDSAGPSVPVLMLGLNSAPQAGDLFNIMSDEKEAKNVASKRHQLMREQSLRTQKHITLDEIGRRIAIGDFKELNVIVKGDVDGSVEALSDALLKLSTREVQVNVIHKAVGAITESDVMLASASDAIIIGFQVRPSSQARKLAEKEEIDIRLYSIIYQATEELKTAIEGMLSPKMEEKITCNVEVREVFNITKVGNIAGCFVLDGKITRHTKIRVIRDGIVIHTGQLGSLKRFKDDVKEVASNYECGLNIDNFNDIKIGDIIEGYLIVEVAR
ncbi:MAG: translation initiation factor IF-2 [Bacteroidetes bacterium]|nr:translation initiation factor IF-2 [Bacteroidota bacterium]